jgi:hypothetical protein
MSDDFVIVADPVECVRVAREASAIEDVGMQHDVAGEPFKAVEAYKEAAAKLREAIELCPEGHPDSKVLRVHVDEVLARAEYLSGLDYCCSPVAKPVDEHIHGCFLTMGSPALLPREQCGCSPWNLAKEEAKIRRSAAAIGGAAGLLTLGPLGGMALGVAAALATTREDQAGRAARQMGDAGVKLLCQARQLDREHRISDTVLSAGHSLVKGTTTQARHVLGQLSEKQRAAKMISRTLSSLGLAFADPAAY